MVVTSLSIAVLRAVWAVARSGWILWWEWELGQIRGSKLCSPVVVQKI